MSEPNLLEITAKEREALWQEMRRDPECTVIQEKQESHYHLSGTFVPPEEAFNDIKSFGTTYIDTRPPLDEVPKTRIKRPKVVKDLKKPPPLHQTNPKKR